MTFLLKGALIEYGSDFLGPLPNVVVFQFNPEQVTRTLEIPPRPTGAAGRETSQAGEVPLEKLDLTAKFSAAARGNLTYDSTTTEGALVDAMLDQGLV